MDDNTSDSDSDNGTRYYDSSDDTQSDDENLDEPYVYEHYDINDSYFKLNNSDTKMPDTFNPNTTKIIANNNKHITSIDNCQFHDRITHIYLTSLPLKHINNVRFPTSLVSLTMSDIQIRDFTSIDRIEQLKELYLMNCNIRDASQVSFPRKLKFISLRFNKISDITGFNFPVDTLNELDLWNNNLTSIGDLTHLSNLTNLNLDENKIRSLANTRFPSNLVSISISNNELKDIDNCEWPEKLKDLAIDQNDITDLSHALSKCDNMISLNLSYNNISEIHPGELPKNIGDLRLSFNQIEDFAKIALPDKVKRLYASGNKITNLENCTFKPELQILYFMHCNMKCVRNCVFPETLAELEFYDNDCVKFENCVLPKSIEKLSFGRNKMTSLQGYEWLADIEIANLALDNNKLKNLNGIAYPKRIKKLNLNENNINDLSGCVFPNGLEELRLSENKIISLANCTFPTSLEVLRLNSNNIRELPVSLTQLHNMRDFAISQNVEIIPEVVVQWMRRRNRFNRGTRRNNVYNDNQNTHDTNVQQSFRKSLQNLLEDVPKLSIEDCYAELEKCPISDDAKRCIHKFCKDRTKHSVHCVSFENVFHRVFNRIMAIENVETRGEVLKIMENEMTESEDKCFTGRITRLINVLTGFCEDIKIQIGNNEQIANIILLLRRKYEGDELREQLKRELGERNYSEDTINTWIGYIDDIGI